MTLKTIATGSSGNSYALMNGEEILLLDLGVSEKTIKRAIDFRVSDIVGCLVTHGHGDHVKSAKDFKNMGKQVFQPYLSESKNQFRKLGSFSVQSFEVPHDNEPCCGFYIEVDGHRILYATDFEYLPCSFRKMRLTDMVVECNHNKELVDRNEMKYQHQIRGHCSCETLIEKVIKENMTSDLRTIILCHMSDDSCDIEKSIGEVKKVVRNGVKVFAARKGLEVELSKYPF